MSSRSSKPELEEALSYEYDERDNLIRVVTDIDVDGDVDSTGQWTYGENDEMLSACGDSGESEACFYFVYDDRGRLRRVEFDDGLDGDIDRTERYAYDESGQLVRVDLDIGNDGSDEMSQFYTWDDGLLARLVAEVADPPMEIVVDYTYNQRGLPVLMEEDSYNDGTVDRVLRSEFDEFDRLIHEVFYEDYPYWHDEWWYEYDRVGRRLRVRHKSQLSDTNTIYSYECRQENGELTRPLRASAVAWGEMFDLSEVAGGVTVGGQIMLGFR